MKHDFRIDVIILSLLVSAVIHALAMFYAKPCVMAHITSEMRSARRGPMKITPAKARVEAVEIARVDDIAPEREAPLPDTETTASPAFGDGALSEITAGDGSGGLALPVLEDLVPSAPETSTLPMSEVISSTLSPVALAPVRMVSDSGLPGFGVTAVSPPSASSADFIGLVRRPSVLPVEITAPETKTVEPIVREAGATPFVPVAEVMERVDREVVEREKSAVRELVNVTTAADLTRAVEMKLAKTVTADGVYFRVTVSPKTVLPVVPKDVVVLIDASGSIGVERMGSIRDAAKNILRSAANTGDRFNLVAFRDRFSYAFRTWQTCSTESFTAADRWLNLVAPYGRTDVFATIVSVLTLPRDPKRPLIALVVTDGEANAGTRETADILTKFTMLNDGLVSVYMYGVRASGNRELIDGLTHGNRGESFIFEGNRWRAGSGIEALSVRFRDPVLSDLRVVFASACPAVAYPRLLKNLYRGETVEIVGRVPTGTNEIAFSLRGLNGSEAYEGFYRLPLASAEIVAGLDASWAAERKCDQICFW